MSNLDRKDAVITGEQFAALARVGKFRNGSQASRVCERYFVGGESMPEISRDMKLHPAHVWNSVNAGRKIIADCKAVAGIAD